LRPGSGDQLLLADHLAGKFDERAQDVKGAADEPHRLVALEEEPLLRQQVKGPEGDRAFGRDRINHSLYSEQ
jgi:hypothetical protein